jgi:hypothetical protein
MYILIVTLERQVREGLTELGCAEADNRTLMVIVYHHYYPVHVAKIPYDTLKRPSIHARNGACDAISNTFYLFPAIHWCLN